MGYFLTNSRELSGNEKKPESRGFKKLSEFSISSLQSTKAPKILVLLCFDAIREGAHDPWPISADFLNPRLSGLFSQPQSITQKGVHARLLTAREREHWILQIFSRFLVANLGVNSANTLLCDTLALSHLLSFSDIAQIIRSRPGKPNQRKGQKEKFMNFAHFCVNSGVFPWENNQGVPNHPQTALSSNRLFLGQKKSRMVLQKDGVRQGNYLLLKGGFVHHDFCFLNKHCFYRVGVGVMLVMFFFWCYGLDGLWDPQLLQTLEAVVIAVGRCVLFHSVVLHCDSVVVRGFPFVFTAAPQIFGVDFFCFLRPSKTAQKERFGSDTVLGPGFFGCSTQCKPIFVAFWELKIRYVLVLGIFCVFGGRRFCFLKGWKIWFGGWGKRMWQG